MPQATPEALPTIAPNVGTGDYVVRRGECMASIAERHGFFWETLWDLPENAELREARRDPNVLQPGDRVTIPPLRGHTEELALDRRHRFRRRGIPERFVLRLTSEADDGGRADVPYTFEVAGLVRDGVTDAEGTIREWIPPQVRRATLTLNPETPSSEVYEIAFGELAPIDSVAGVAERLAALGLGQVNADFHGTLSAFQGMAGLEITGESDAATLAKLEELFGR